jgi:transposase
VSVAIQAIMEGMPESADLHAVVHDGRTVLMAGSVALAGYDNDDVGLRNMAVVTLTRLGFTGRRVGQVVGLTPEYVSELRGRERREGSAGLVRGRGRPAKLSDAQVRRARAWKADGLRDAEIARRLGVSHKTAARAAADADISVVQGELDLPAPVDAPVAGAADLPEPPEPPEPGEPGVDCSGGVVAGAGPAADPGGDAVSGGSARIDQGRFTSRYAGAALLHAFSDRVGATDVFARALGAAAAVPARPGLRFDDVAVLTAASVAFGLGFASLEQAKHPDRAQVGPVAGITVLPELRTLRPRLAGIAERCDPLVLQRAFATAMLTAEPNTSGVYFVDEHFMPYTGALPVGEGWNTKRRHAEPGRVDTLIADAAGRAICFTTGEPSGLSTSLPATLDQLRQVVGPDAPIMLGFDRGGAYPVVFRLCRQNNVHWITYRRGKPVTPAGLPIHATISRPGRCEVTVAYAEDTVQIKDYGAARQITLFDQGRPVLQILTSDTTTCPTTLIVFMRARWRIENLFKYLDFYGIDYLADYHATIKTNTRKVDNPERVKLRKQLADLVQQRDQLRERIGALHTDRTITIAALNRESTTAQRRIHALDKKITAVEATLKTVPAKLPANLVNPHAQRAIHRTQRRALQMVLRLLTANAEHWLAHHLNAYLQDENEYRAVTRNLLHLAGTITYTDTTIHIELDKPNTARLARALTLLLAEINHTPPHIPGDPRPLTYTLKP